MLFYDSGYFEELKYTMGFNFLCFISFLYNSMFVQTQFWYFKWETAASKLMRIKENTLNSQSESKLLTGSLYLCVNQLICSPLD